MKKIHKINILKMIYIASILIEKKKSFSIDYKIRRSRRKIIYNYDTQTYAWNYVVAIKGYDSEGGRLADHIILQSVFDLLTEDPGAILNTSIPPNNTTVNIARAIRMIKYLKCTSCVT